MNMKKIKLVKKNFYIAIVVVVLLFVATFVIAQWDSSKASHEILYTNRIEPKTGSDVNIAGNLLIDGNPFIGGYWTLTGNDIYYNDGNVGIGTTEPGFQLDVKGRTVVGTWHGTSADGGYYDVFDLMWIGDHDESLYVLGGIRTDGNIVVDSGNVGIGTTSPAGKLEVVTTTATDLMYLTAPETVYKDLRWKDSTSGELWQWSHRAHAAGNSFEAWYWNGAAWNPTPSLSLATDGNVGIGTTSPSVGEESLKLDVEGPVGATKYCDENGNNCKAITEMTPEIMDCTVWKFDNRAGTSWKYFRWDMPYECKPIYQDADEKSWGCFYHLSPEHHSSNRAGYWDSERSGEFAIIDNFDNTGRHLFVWWDAGSYWRYDLDSGGGSENILHEHRIDVCRGTEGYYDGSWHRGYYDSGFGGWRNWGMSVNQYTICYLKICEYKLNEGPTGATTHTYGG